eukprot:3476422-Rhodomonas_salina.1
MRAMGESDGGVQMAGWARLRVICEQRGNPELGVGAGMDGEAGVVRARERRVNSAGADLRKI